ncbi:MAG: hypothetical protein ACU84H_17700 [Gammaproteobacteria bacterium]
MIIGHFGAEAFVRPPSRLKWRQNGSIPAMMTGITRIAACFSTSTLETDRKPPNLQKAIFL